MARYAPIGAAVTSEGLFRYRRLSPDGRAGEADPRLRDRPTGAGGMEAGTEVDALSNGEDMAMTARAAVASTAEPLGAAADAADRTAGSGASRAHQVAEAMENAMTAFRRTASAVEATGRRFVHYQHVHAEMERRAMEPGPDR